MTSHEPQAAAMRALLTFEISGHRCALPIESVKEIVFMAKLSKPPGSPSILDGFLNLRGDAIPVLRLARLFQMPEGPLGLYTPLVITRMATLIGAIIVDRVDRIVSVPADSLLPVTGGLSFNGFLQAAVPFDDDTIHLLDPDRLLIEEERTTLTEFQKVAELRVADLEVKEAS